MGAWDNIMGVFLGKAGTTPPVPEDSLPTLPDALPARLMTLDEVREAQSREPPAGRKTIVFRRMTAEETRARDSSERKERRARSII